MARGVIKGVVESGFDPAEKILFFRIPGAVGGRRFQDPRKVWRGIRRPHRLDVGSRASRCRQARAIEPFALTLPTALTTVSPDRNERLWCRGSQLCAPQINAIAMLNMDACSGPRALSKMRFLSLLVVVIAALVLVVRIPSRSPPRPTATSIATGASTASMRPSFCSARPACSRRFPVRRRRMSTTTARSTASMRSSSCS